MGSARWFSYDFHFIALAPASRDFLEMVRLVDIFSGCGGLSLGFELHSGPTSFRTCLAIDNEPSATRIYNANHNGSSQGGTIGRTADVCWFTSPAEIRLFYLSHIAKLEADAPLKAKLSLVGFGKFLSELRALDEFYEQRLRHLNSQAYFRLQVSQIETATYALASVKNILKSLGVKAFNRVSLDERYLPWAEESRDQFWLQSSEKWTPVKAKGDFGKRLWKSIVDGLVRAASKSGRGQHAGNSRRYAAILVFLRSNAGRELEDILTQWRSLRQQVIAGFTTRTKADIELLYSTTYKVAGLLGGPPCKGFSRIGRPVANSLRDQGVFAWSSDEYGDERNKLVLHYVMFLEALRPDFFVFENVSNFQSTLKTPDGILQADEVFAEAVANLSSGKLSYEVAARQVNAAAFAVPQSRIRYIMFGVNNERFPKKAKDFLDLREYSREISVSEAFYGLPRPTEFSPTNEASTGQRAATCGISPPESDLTLKEYFRWIQASGENKRGETDGHIYRRMREDDKAFFQFVGPGIRWMDWELRGSPTLSALKSALKGKKDLVDLIEGNLALRLILEETTSRFKLNEQHLLHPSYLKNRSGTHGDWLERLAGDRPSKTVVAHIGKDTYGYIHPFETRPITVREAARLQSFPDAFSFAASGVVDAYTAIGNAVPPMLANVFARKIAALLFGEYDAAKDRTVIPLVRQRRHR